MKNEMNEIINEMIKLLDIHLDVLVLWNFRARRNDRRNGYDPRHSDFVEVPIVFFLCKV
jgi:hypothetical protein